MYSQSITNTQELINWLKKIWSLFLAKSEHRTQSLKGNSGFVQCEGESAGHSKKRFQFLKKHIPGSHVI